MLIASLLLGQVKTAVPLIAYATSQKNIEHDNPNEVISDSDINNLEETSTPESEGNTGEETSTPESEGNTGEETSTPEGEGETEEVTPTPESEGETEEEVTPTPEGEGETEEEVTPTPEGEGETEEEVTPTPEGEGETEEEVTPTPEGEGETEEEVTPTPEGEGETEEEVTPTPEGEGETEEEVTPTPEGEGETEEEVTPTPEDEEETEESDKEVGMPDPYSAELPKASGAGLVQLWQTVPSGQTSKENVSQSTINNALTCKPNHDLYDNGGIASHDTYVNSCYVDDALYLGEDANYFDIYIAGYEGKVAKKKSHYFELDLNGDGTKVKYEIQTVAYFIPASSTTTYTGNPATVDAQLLEFSTDKLDKYTSELGKTVDLLSDWVVKSPSYYANENGTLVHYLTNNVRGTSYSKTIIGKAPSWMKTNTRYYSYDGIYFYSDWKNIKVNGTGAVNASTPFYNYYQWLPFRSTTNYKASNIDTYTKAYGYSTTSQSKLVNTGQYFYNVQDKYGINSALQYAMGIHESGWGRSSLSFDKNNLFGMNATDNNPYGNGLSFPNVEAGINYHADRYLSWGYTDPLDDWRYMGSHVGNKGSGMNVRYASDPFWGEKIAGWYYRFDQNQGMKDYNYYSIGIKQSNTIVSVKSQPNNSSSTLYQTKNGSNGLKIYNYPFLISGESNGYYKVQTDTPIVNGKPVFSASYNFKNSVGYIPKSSITSVNHLNNKAPDQLNYIEFVTRFYELVHGRQPDEEGLNYWVNKLSSGAVGPGDLVRHFVNSPEFQGENYSNEQFVIRMYELLQDRTPDKEGLNYWVGKLNMGLTWDYVIVGFVNSKEYQNNCNVYGVQWQKIDYIYSIDKYSNITDFVNNFYLKGHGRKPDSEGLTYWVENLALKKITGQIFTERIFLSTEMQNKNLSNKEFVTRVYRTVLMREPDKSGLDYWTKKLSSGMSRKDFLNYFTNAPEYINKCNSLGIKTK